MTTSIREGGDSVEVITSRTAAQNESQSRHTAGPWKTGFHLHTRRFSRENAIEIQDARESMVAVLFKLNRDANGDEDAANARLIAAAPDLFAALHRMLDCHQAAIDAAQSSASRFVEKQCKCGACDDARVAIAKAEGN